MKVVLNGALKEVPEGATLQRLLDELHITPTRVACEVKGKIIKRAHYSDTTLCEGDTIEIVHMVAGG